MTHAAGVSQGGASAGVVDGGEEQGPQRPERRRLGVGEPGENGGGLIEVLDGPVAISGGEGRLAVGSPGESFPRRAPSSGQRMTDQVLLHLVGVGSQLGSFGEEQQRLVADLAQREGFGQVVGGAGVVGRGGGPPAADAQRGQLQA